MEADLEQHNKRDDDIEDYILLELSEDCIQSHIPANASYVLSGLDTPTPMLIIDSHLKLIGEYAETIGTCFVFSEKDAGLRLTQHETGPSEANLFKDTRIIDPNEMPSKQVKPMASLQKILKFRKATEEEIQRASRITAGN